MALSQFALGDMAASLLYCWYAESRSSTELLIDLAVVIFWIRSGINI